MLVEGLKVEGRVWFHTSGFIQETKDKLLNELLSLGYIVETDDTFDHHLVKVPVVEGKV